MEFKDLLKLREKYNETHMETKKASEKESTLLKELRENCSHPNRFVAEAPYESETMGSSTLPPLRVCEICGTLEEGWGCGYKKLANKKVYNISREEANEMRLPLGKVEQ